jgi:hypothetical protein
VLVCFVLVWFGLVWFGLVWFGLSEFSIACMKTGHARMMGGDNQKLACGQYLHVCVYQQYRACVTLLVSVMMLPAHGIGVHACALCMRNACVHARNYGGGSACDCSVCGG